MLRNGEEIRLPSKAGRSLEKGDVVRVVSGGGGGYGDPGERNKTLIEADLLAEKISRWPVSAASAV